MTGAVQAMMGSGEEDSLIVTVNRTNVSKVGSSFLSTVTSESVSVSVEGYNNSGSGPSSPANLTYAWTVTPLVPATAGSVFATNASSSSTAFRGTNFTAGEVRTATAYCTVTDTVTGDTGRSATVNIRLERLA